MNTSYELTPSRPLEATSADPSMDTQPAQGLDSVRRFGFDSQCDDPDLDLADWPANPLFTTCVKGVGSLAVAIGLGYSLTQAADAQPAVETKGVANPTEQGTFKTRLANLDISTRSQLTSELSLSTQFTNSRTPLKPSGCGDAIGAGPCEASLPIAPNAQAFDLATLESSLAADMSEASLSQEAAVAASERLATFQSLGRSSDLNSPDTMATTAPLPGQPAAATPPVASEASTAAASSMVATSPTPTTPSPSATVAAATVATPMASEPSPQFSSAPSTPRQTAATADISSQPQASSPIPMPGDEAQAETSARSLTLSEFFKLSARKLEAAKTTLSQGNLPVQVSMLSE
jgi:hypothetical protein